MWSIREEVAEVTVSKHKIQMIRSIGFLGDLEFSIQAHRFSLHQERIAGDHHSPKPETG
jgi:hypothetical protein